MGFPHKCGKTPHGPPAGRASGSYCAKKCSHLTDCPSVSGLQRSCAMNQGHGQQYCEYKCKSDSDCPSSGSCQVNVASSICTYEHPAPRRRRSSPTPTRRRRRGSVAEEIAEQANALFNSDDDGVYFRITPLDLKAVDQEQTHTTTQSFVLLNKYAWGNDVIQLYVNGSRPGYIAKPHARENVACLYPCDGDSMDRHYSCHVRGCPCDASGNDDWCDHELRGEPHKPCAFKPD